MWNLNPLHIENYREHLDIAFPLGAIPEAVSEAEKDVLLHFYHAYEQNLGRPSVELVGEDLRPALLKSVHDAYGLVQDGRRLAKLRSSLKLLAQMCPYCGFGQVDEIDHLLQRAQYNLFSIFPLNLVPCCGPCNRGKRRATSERASEHQLHVYLENVSNYEFLRASARVDVASGGLVVQYFISQPEEMSDDLYARLNNHLVEFKLHERYQKQVNIYLGSLEYPIVSTFQNMGAEGLRDFLRGMANSNLRREGVNDWRTALMRGLVECPEFYQGGFKTALGLERAAQVKAG